MLSKAFFDTYRRKIGNKNFFLFEQCSSFECSKTETETFNFVKMSL